MALIVGDKEDRGFLQGSECNFRFFQVCLCKMGCKLPVLLRMKIPVPLKKIRNQGRQEQDKDAVPEIHVLSVQKIKTYIVLEFLILPICAVHFLPRYRCCH